MSITIEDGRDTGHVAFRSMDTSKDAVAFLYCNDLYVKLKYPDALGQGAFCFSTGTNVYFSGHEQVIPVEVKVTILRNKPA